MTNLCIISWRKKMQHKNKILPYKTPVKLSKLPITTSGPVLLFSGD
jgi:hypothetical protein